MLNSNTNYYSSFYRDLHFAFRYLVDTLMDRSGPHLTDLFLIYNSPSVIKHIKELILALANLLFVRVCLSIEMKGSVESFNIVFLILLLCRSQAKLSFNQFFIEMSVFDC